MKNHQNDSEGTIIFVASITTKKGKKIYAYQYGKKAFPIKIKNSKQVSSMRHNNLYNCSNMSYCVVIFILYTFVEFKDKNATVN